MTPDGGFLFADNESHRIRRVSPEGIITTVAGSSEGYSGDGGPATVAQLETPGGVTATPDGDFLIADTLNERIRFVDADLLPPADPEPAPPEAEDPPVETGPTPPAPQDPRAPQDPPGLPGDQDPSGQDAPTGQAGPASQRLVLRFAARRLRARPGRRLTLVYRAGAPASVKLSVVRNGRRVARVRDKALPGRNRIELRVPRRPGRYRLKLAASTAEGLRAGAQARLIVTSAQRGR